MQASSLGQPLPPLIPHSASETLQNLLRLIAKITSDDVKNAERCGGGGFGDVYVLTHAAIGKLALKCVRTSGNQEEVDAQLRRSAREAETWKRLDHPNILPFLDVLKRSDYIYLVSPFVRNRSPTEFTQRHPEVNRGQLIQEVAAGIAYLHQNGIVHGDIKGANILVSDDVRSLLCDFGLARSQQVNTCTEMQGVGTVRWQSPELLQSGAGKSFKSDVWTFAMTIYEVLSGQIPYHQCDSAYAVIIAIMVHKKRPSREPATSPTGASYASLWEVAGACWHEDPDQRPEIHEAHNRLIFSGFRSLLLSPPARDDEDSPQPPPSSRVLGKLDGDVRSVAFSLDGTTIATSSTSRAYTIQLWDAETGGEKGGPLTGHTDVVYCLAFSPDGTTIASGSNDKTLRLWDPAAASQIGKPFKGHTDDVFCLAFSPDGTTIATGSSDTHLRFWDVKTKNRMGRLWQGHYSVTYGVAFSPDGKTVITGSSDRTLRLWDVEARTWKSTIVRVDDAAVFCLAFSLDGMTIATGLSDHTIRLWDVKTRSQIGEPLKGHTDDVYSLVFSPDGKTIATGSGDHTIRFWDLESKRQRGGPLTDHTSLIWCLAFSPDRKSIVSGSFDGTIRSWDISL